MNSPVHGVTKTQTNTAKWLPLSLPCLFELSCIGHSAELHDLKELRKKRGTITTDNNTGCVLLYFSQKPEFGAVFCFVSPEKQRSND